MEKDPIFAEAERLYMLENPGGCLAAEDETVKRYWMGKITTMGPPMVWPLASHVADEMIARGWVSTDVAIRMPGDHKRNLLMVDLFLAVQDPKMILDDGFFSCLSQAFDVSKEYFSNIHSQWLMWPNARQDFECPESLLSGFLWRCCTIRTQVLYMG